MRRQDIVVTRFIPAVGTLRDDGPSLDRDAKEWPAFVAATICAISDTRRSMPAKNCKMLPSVMPDDSRLSDTVSSCTSTCTRYGHNVNGNLRQDKRS